MSVKFKKVVKGIDFGSSLLRSNPQSKTFAVCPWVSYLTLLKGSFLTYKI